MPSNDPPYDPARFTTNTISWPNFATTAYYQALTADEKQYGPSAEYTQQLLGFFKDIHAKVENAVATGQSTIDRGDYVPYDSSSSLAAEVNSFIDGIFQGQDTVNVTDVLANPNFASGLETFNSASSTYDFATGAEWDTLGSVESFNEGIAENEQKLGDYVGLINDRLDIPEEYDEEFNTWLSGQLTGENIQMSSDMLSDMPDDWIATVGDSVQNLSSWATDESVANVAEAVDIANVIEVYETRTGEALTEQQVRDRELVGLSEEELNTRMLGDVRTTLSEQLQSVGQGVLDILFGEGKSVEQILQEQVDQIEANINAPWLQGSIISVTHDPEVGVFASIRFPVPLPVNGPPIIIPLFDQDGNYEGGRPLDMANVVINQAGEMLDETRKRIGQIATSAGGTVAQIFGADGAIVNTARLAQLGVDAAGNPTYGVLNASGEEWTEGDPNPWELNDADGDQVIDPQVDASGNPVDPETGLPVVEDPDDSDAVDTGKVNPLAGTDDFPSDSDDDDVDDDVDDGMAEGDRLAYLSDVTTAKEEVLAILGPDGSVGQALTQLGLDADEIEDLIGHPAIEDNPDTTDVDESEEATGLHALIGEAATPQDIINAVGIPEYENGELVGGTGLYGELLSLGYDVDQLTDTLGAEAVYENGELVTPASGVFSYIDTAKGEIYDYIGSPATDTEPATGVYLALDQGGAAFNDFVGVAPTRGEDGELVGGSGLLLTLAQQGVELDAIPSVLSDLIGAPPEYDATGELVEGTGTKLYGELLSLGYDVDQLTDTLGAEAVYENGELVTPASGVFSYIDTAKGEIYDYIGSPATDTEPATGVYEAIEGGNQAVMDYVGHAATEDSPATGLFLELENQGVAIDAIPGVVASIVGVPEYNDADELVGGTGLYGEFVSLGVATDRIEDTLGTLATTEALGAVASDVGSIQEALGTAGVESDDPDTEIDETLPTGIYADIAALEAQGIAHNDAVTLAINNFTSNGQYSLEDVLTAVDASEDNVKAFIGTPGAEVDDPDTEIDETLPTGIYEGIAASEAGLSEDIAGVATDVAGVATDVADLSELVTTYEEQGLTRDEALSQAISDLSGELGLTEEALLTSLGETEETILASIDTAQAETDEYLDYISALIGIPTSDITQDDVDSVVALMAEDEAITDINNDVRMYDTNRDGIIDQTDIDMMQGLVDSGVEGVGTIPASGLYADAATKADEMKGLVSSEAERTRGLMSQQNMLNMIMGAGDATGRKVDVTTPDPAKIDYIYDFSDIFATPQQKGLFPSPYGGPQRAQQQQIAQKRGIMSSPLQMGGMARGGKVDYDFANEIMQIMSHGDN